MDNVLVELMSEALAQESRAHIRNLVAAEQAVSHGRFNIAKIMRAAAHASRARAMNLQRLLVEGEPPEALRALIETQEANQQSRTDYLDPLLKTLAQDDQRDLTTRIEVTLRSRQSLLSILARSKESLKSHRDVMETDVAQPLWGCYECGYIAEENLPDVCPMCGALAAEFERFGPFYSGTNERLGQQRPEDVKSNLVNIADEVSQEFQGLAEAALRQRPSPTEWCIKEIAGHILDVHELFINRIRLLMDPSQGRSFDTPVPPWRILEGKGYPEMPTEKLLAQLRSAAEKTLSLVNQLTAKDWALQGVRQGRAVSGLDLGTWLTNHNKGHLVQIRELRQQWLGNSTSAPLEL